MQEKKWVHQYISNAALPCPYCLCIYYAVKQDTPSSVSQHTAFLFFYPKHKICLTNYNIGLQEALIYKEVWYEEAKRKQNNYSKSAAGNYFMFVCVVSHLSDLRNLSARNPWLR